MVSKNKKFFPPKRIKTITVLILSLVLLLPLFTINSNAGMSKYVGVTLSRYDYDYAPSVMYGDGSYIKMWWGGGTGSGDGIYYAYLSSSGWSTPQLVFQKASSGWDSQHVCDPSVVKGSYTYKNKSYSYAMYYTGTYDSVGYDSHIGVAFSNNGTTWVRCNSNPIISPYYSAVPSTGQYGAGMPTVYNNLNGTITLAYIDSTLGGNYMVTSSNGISFSNRQQLPNPRDDEHIGDIAYSPTENKWDTSMKNANDQEIYMYETSTSSLLSTWNYTGRVSSLTTGNYKNHNPGWLRDTNGDIYIESDTNYKYIYYGTGTSSTSTWNIGQSIYSNGWEFQISGEKEGWTAYNVSGDTGPSAGGPWTVIADQSDPYWLSPTIELPADYNKYLQLSIANQTNDTQGKIYFKTSTENYYDESKTISFTCTNGGAWYSYSIDMSANAKWTGVITGIRIDPVSAGNNNALGIEYIRFSNT